MKTLAIFLSILMITGPFGGFCAEAVNSEKDYLISSGDIVNINVFPAEEFSRELTVQPDGNIEIPLLGAVRAGGLHTDELRKILEAKFSKYVANPSITINVRKFSSNMVSIIGQVHMPGHYEYREGMRLLDLVALAQGAQDYAKGSEVKIYRRAKDGNGQFSENVITTDLSAVFNGKMDKNLTLASGDIVYVPRKGYSSTAKWISDNLAPWLTVLTFITTITILSRK